MIDIGAESYYAILALEFCGERRSVHIEMGPVLTLPGRSPAERSLAMRTDAGAESRQVVRDDIAWLSVLTHARFLLQAERDEIARALGKPLARTRTKDKEEGSA